MHFIARLMRLSNRTCVWTGGQDPGLRDKIGDPEPSKRREMAEVSAALLFVHVASLDVHMGHSPLQAGTPVGTSDMHVRAAEELRVDLSSNGPGMALFSRIRNEKSRDTPTSAPGVALRVVGGNRFRNKDEIPQTFLLFKKQGEALCCSSSLPQPSVLYLDDGDTNPFNMSEKKDITRAPDDTDNLESGELYGVKTNPNPPTDAVFGEISEGGPNFKSVCCFSNMGWAMILECVVCMTDTL